MNVYAVSVGPKAHDWFDECLDAKLKRRIGDTIDALASNPRPSGCAKLAGEKSTWCVRVSDHRILYEIHDDRLVVLIVRIANRREAYR